MQSRSPEAAAPSGAVEEIAPRPWDHDHCDFCWEKLMDTAAGYTPAPPDERFASVWVCPTCFDDFRERFGWSVVEAA